MFGLFDGLPHGLGIIDHAPDLMDTLRQLAREAPGSMIADEAGADSNRAS
jgi:hypothetical protein